MGPASASLLSNAPPVIPGISWFDITVTPLQTMVTILPINVISYDCHSPASFAIISDGGKNPYNPPK